MLRSRANVSDVAVVERVKCSAREDSGARLDEFPYRWKCLDDHLRSPPSPCTDGQRRLSVFGPDPPTSFIPIFRRAHSSTDLSRQEANLISSGQLLGWLDCRHQ